MTKRRHILICGEIGAGKSTLLRRLLAHNRRPVYGFVTRRATVPGSDGLFPVHIHPASQPEGDWTCGPDNLIGACDRVHSVRYPAVFDVYGTALLQAPPEALLLMDELGFMENDAPLFRSGVLAALDGSAPVLAAVKARDTDFLRAVKQHPQAALYHITTENREALYQRLLPCIQLWNSGVS